MVITKITIKNSTIYYEMVVTVRNDIGFDITNISIKYACYNEGGSEIETASVSSKDTLAAVESRGIKINIPESTRSVRFSVINYNPA